MSGVGEAQKELQAARQELEGVLESRAASEATAWSDWIDAQVREFIRTQPDALELMGEAQKRALKEAIEGIRDAQRAVISNDVRKLKGESTSDLVVLANEYEWSKSMESYGEPVAKRLRSAGFETDSTWGSGWLERAAFEGAPALTTSHTNGTDSRRFASAVTRVKRAEQALERAQKNAAGTSALGAWDLL